MESEMEQTYDYEQFVICGWNRPVREKNLRKIDDCVKQDGWLKHPIMINENNEVIDGQHRLTYAKEHKLPVYYVKVPGLTKEDCIAMNNRRTGWTLSDYINFYAEQGNQNYILFRAMTERYSFVPISIIYGIIKTTGVGGYSSRAIKEGAFVISRKESELAQEKLDFLDSCQEYVQRVPGRGAAIYQALAFAYSLKGISKARLAKQVKNYLGIITPPANLDMALKEIEKLYNYRNSKDKYVQIYNEYKSQALERMVHRKGEKNG